MSKLTAFRTQDVVVDTKTGATFMVIAFTKDAAKNYSCAAVTADGKLILVPCNHEDFRRNREHDHLSFQKAWFQANTDKSFLVRGSTKQVGTNWDDVTFTLDNAADGFSVAQMLKSCGYEKISVFDYSGKKDLFQHKNIDLPFAKWYARVMSKLEALFLLTP